MKGNIVYVVVYQDEDGCLHLNTFSTFKKATAYFKKRLVDIDDIEQPYNGAYEKYFEGCVCLRIETQTIE